MSRLKSKLSYANVMATIAVFVALGGGAYAAVKIPKKSVGTKQLKANAVTNPKVGDNAIGSAELINGSVALKDTAVLDTTVTQNFGNVAANSCQSISKAVSAVVQKTDQVVVIPDPTVAPDAGDGEWYADALMAEAGPTTIAPEAAIKLHVCNPTGAASADPGNTVFRVLVFR